MSKQTILITGATTGIGRHAALHLARRGHHVIASGRNRAALDTLVAEAEGLHLDAVTLDVTSPSSIAAAAGEVDRLTRGAGVDVLINNAGFGLVAAVDEMSDADARALFDTNVFGLLAVTRAFVPQMRARGRGRIVHVGSIGGKVTMPFLGVYTATKYAVESLSDAMRQELEPFGIDVVLVEPGAIRTEFNTTSMKGVARYGGERSPYAAVYANAERILALASKQAVGPEVISRVLARAVESRRPAPRYVAPFSGKLAVFLGRALPTRLVDWVLRRVFGLTRARLGAARPGAAATADSPRLAA